MARKICVNCFYYDALYTKGLCQFEKRSFAYCRKNRKTVKNTESCDDWTYNSDKRKSDSKQMHQEIAANVIDKMQKNLSEIRQILSED